MPKRLQIISAAGFDEIVAIVGKELKDLTGKDSSISPQTQAPLNSCCRAVADAGAKAVLVQRHVQDPDFSAEYAAYYSRQFSHVQKFCTRVHFFRLAVEAGESELGYIDRVPESEYIGFITLRPVVKSPVGATIIQGRSGGAFIRSSDIFPVHIAGKAYSVLGTPFMQQDNAVGACAQASIWMALRTLRKREGDRAHDPAQITDAATKYFVTGRTRPNRQGLTEQQMTEAIRAAGYSPHLIPLGDFWYRNGQASMQDAEIASAIQKIHPYVESEIPVILILYPPSGGHAVVVIGHSWDQAPTVQRTLSHDVGSINGAPPFSLSFLHAATWAPSFVIHNDNSGPYRILKERDQNDYSMQHGASAIPLLPMDVFMSAEEAQTLALTLISTIFAGFVAGGIKTQDEIQQLTSTLVVRLSLVDKRKLRKWAASNDMAPELREEIRLMDSPKRLWVFELHKSEHYPTHETSPQKTQVGMVLIDSTGDDVASSVLLMHINLPELLEGFDSGALLRWDPSAGVPLGGAKTSDNGPICPLR